MNDTTITMTTSSPKASRIRGISNGIVALTRALSKISTPKVPVWRFQSTLEAVFNPLHNRDKDERKNEIMQARAEAAEKKKKRNKYITYDEETTTKIEQDHSVYGKIKKACTCTPEFRTPEMLVLLDSVTATPFFRSFHVTWRREMLKRIELVEIAKGFSLFTQGKNADCAYFLLSGRLSNEVLIANKITDMLKAEKVESKPGIDNTGTIDSTAGMSSSSQRNVFTASRERNEEKEKKQKEKAKTGREYMRMSSFMPGSELDVDCLRPSREGQPLRTRRNRTVKAIDDCYLFRLSKEMYDEGVAVSDYNEDYEILDFFKTKAAGGLIKIFQKFSNEMNNEWKEMWHLKTFESGALLTKQGDRCLKAYVLAVGTLHVIRKNLKNQLLIIDRPRIGEFAMTGASDIIQHVQQTIPVYKTIAATSLVAKTATDCYEADASLFYNFCYKFRWFSTFLYQYFHAMGLSDRQSMEAMTEQKKWNSKKTFIIKKNVGWTFRSTLAKGLQKGTIAIDPRHVQRKIKRKKVHRLKPLVVAGEHAAKEEDTKAEEGDERSSKMEEMKKKEGVHVVVERAVGLGIGEREEQRVIEGKERGGEDSNSEEGEEGEQSNVTSHYCSANDLLSSVSIYQKLTLRNPKKVQNKKKVELKTQALDSHAKERIKMRQEASLKQYQKRFGTHMLLRGSNLRWLIHDASLKMKMKTK